MFCDLKVGATLSFTNEHFTTVYALPSEHVWHCCQYLVLGSVSGTVHIVVVLRFSCWGGHTHTHTTPHHTTPHHTTHTHTHTHTHTLIDLRSSLTVLRHNHVICLDRCATAPHEENGSCDITQFFLPSCSLTAARIPRVSQAWRTEGFNVLCFVLLQSRDMLSKSRIV